MADHKRAWNFALGLRLGAFQQGAHFGGRDRDLMKDDLRSMLSAAPLAGYAGGDELVASGLRKLNANLHLSTLKPEADALIRLFQPQAVVPRYFAALTLGIVLGQLQQGAGAHNRPRELARLDITNARTLAPATGYVAYAPSLDAAAALLDAGHPVSALLLGVTALISLLQGQDLAPDPPGDPMPPTDPVPPTDPMPPGGLRIWGDATYVGVNEIVILRSNVPTASAGSVSWSSSDPNVLVQTSRPGEFRGTRAGRATVTARFGTQQASVPVLVNSDSSIPVVPAPDPSKVTVYPGTNARVYRDELMCEFKPGVDVPTQLAVLKQHGLSRIGVIPGLRSYLVRFDDTQSTLPTMLARLAADARISTAAPHSVLKYGSLPPHFPSEAPQTDIQRWPQLSKVEAFAAFSLLRNIARDPQRIAFIDGPIWVDAGATHTDFADRLELGECAHFGYDIGSTYPVTLQDLKETGTDPYEHFHGNKVIGTAIAGWNNGAAVGLDPRARAGLILCRSFWAAKAGVSWVSARLGAGYRVVNITIDSYPELPSWKVRGPIVQAIDKRGLVVIAAANDSSEVTKVSFGSAQVEFTSAADQKYRDATIVVAGTETRSDVEGPETFWSNTNFDSHRKYIDMAAPAVVLTSGPNNDTIVDTGTSHAAPLVSATAAIIFSILPDQTAAWVKTCLVDSSDPIQYGPQVYPPYRLWSPKYIGKGRLNVWQAILYALNARERAAGTKARYAGLRITADRDDMRLFLKLPDDTLIELGTSVLNEAHKTTANRATMTNKAPFTWPVELIGREPGSLKVAYRFRIPPPERTDTLKSRQVFTVRAFTQGRFVISQDAENPVAHQRRVTIANLAMEPGDDEIVDPLKRSPWDESIRPWMVLTKGDSFAVSYQLAGPPETTPGTTIEILDKNQRPFPASQIEDKEPYLTIPFKDGEDSFFVRAKFSGVGPAQAKVTVTVCSLNNRANCRSIECTLSRGNIQGGELPGFLQRPRHWWLFGILRMTNPGPGAVSTRLQFKPSAGWRAHYHEYPPWADVNLAPGGQTDVTVRFSPEPESDAPPGTKGTCDVVSVDEEGNPTGFHHQFTGLIEPPPLVRIEAPSWQADSVRKVPGENYVFAELPITIFNDSKYTVEMRRRYLKVTGSPLSVAHKEPVQIPYTGANERQPIPSGGRYSTKIVVFYDPGMVNPTNPVTARHTITLFLEDPNHHLWLFPYPPPDYDGYTAQPFEVKVRLKLAGAAPPTA